MRKILDLKAGAIFHREMDRITLCIRRECIEVTPVLCKVTTLVNKNIAIYNELSSNPPFPTWKDGLMEVWNR